MRRNELKVEGYPLTLFMLTSERSCAVRLWSHVQYHPSPVSMDPPPLERRNMHPPPPANGPPPFERRIMPPQEFFTNRTRITFFCPVSWFHGGM